MGKKNEKRTKKEEGRKQKNKNKLPLLCTSVAFCWIIFRHKTNKKKKKHQKRKKDGVHAARGR
jgi:hypothetical protein